jgi:chromosome segregation ATPase
MENLKNLEKRAWAGEKLTPEQTKRMREEISELNIKAFKAQKPHLIIEQIVRKFGLSCETKNREHFIDKAGEDGILLLELYDQLRERYESLNSELRSVHKAIEGIQETMCAVLIRDAHLAGYKEAMAYMYDVNI